VTTSPASPVYDTIGRHYTTHRRADPRWEAVVDEQLGDATRIVNVGAGTGSYEPAGRSVVAVEPSTVMLRQRAPGAAPAARASGSALPIRSGWAEVAMAILTVHHWDDWERGMDELCRVAPRRVVLGIDFEAHGQFWLLQEYLPSVLEHTLRCRPGADAIAEAIGATTSIVLPTYADLQDGVLGAHWARPEAYLDPVVRANNSGCALADPASMSAGIAQLEADLASGAWHERHSDLLALESIDMGYRLLVAE
jgi:SAM-dependent methyltransferase